MTQLAILTREEQRAFETPPTFQKIDRPRYFSLTPDIRKQGYNLLRTDVNRVGFVLQLGYFRAAGKFFVTSDFRRRDIQYVSTLLQVDGDIDMRSYSESSRKSHRDTILALAGWTLPDETSDEALIEQTRCFIEQQHSPRQVFESLIEYCWSHKLAIPTYHTLTTCITNYYNVEEARLLDLLASEMSSEQESSLRSLIEPDDNEKALPRPTITLLKTISQSAKPNDIQKSVDDFELIRRYHLEFDSIHKHLKLSDQATEYFAQWVQKAQTFQLTRFASPLKSYLHVLAFLKHQVCLRQDTLIDLLLKATLTAKSQLTTQLQKSERDEQSARNTAIQLVSKSNRDLAHFKNEVIRIVMQAPYSEGEKIRQLERLIEQHLKSYDEKATLRMRQMETYLEDLTGQDRYYVTLEAMSLRLQRRVASIIKAIDFSSRSTNKTLLAAIAHFKATDGDVGHSPPVDFLSADERNAVLKGTGFRVSLYKALLFLHIADAIKSGQLIFDATYRYKGIFDYLISEDDWGRNRDSLLGAAGLTEFGDVTNVLAELRRKLGAKYTSVNARIAAGENPLFSLDRSNNWKRLQYRSDHLTALFDCESLLTGKDP